MIGAGIQWEGSFRLILLEQNVATKITTEQVYAHLVLMAPASSTELAAKLGVSSSTIKAHLNKLRDEERAHIVPQHAFGGHPRWGHGKGLAQRKKRADDGKSREGITRRSGTMSDVPRASGWGGHVLVEG
jgi:DNA-binding MarR family transcriptional regulator